jgi:hypothetical protein
LVIKAVSSELPVLILRPRRSTDSYRSSIPRRRQ